MSATRMAREAKRTRIINIDKSSSDDDIIMITSSDDEHFYNICCTVLNILRLTCDTIFICFSSILAELYNIFQLVV